MVSDVVKVDGLKGQVAVVFGASGGLGKAINCKLSYHGATVVSVGYRRSTLVNAIVDIRDEYGIGLLVNQIVSMQGRIDILVNAAGIYYDDFAVRNDVGKVRDVLDVNLIGPLITMKYVIPNMQSNQYGRIVNIGSMAAKTAMAGTSAYSASKAGLEAATRAVAREVAQHNITANVVHPGTFSAGMPTKFSEASIERLKGMTSIGRFGLADELANTVAFLVSPGASYINGGVIHVDGGI